MSRGQAVAITGIGPVSAIGTGEHEFWRALLDGRSGLARLTRFVPRRGCAIGAEVTEPPFRPLDLVNPLPRAVELALHAARLAFDDAQPTIAKERIGVVVGTGVGNGDLVEAVSQLPAGQRTPAVAAFRAFSHAAAVEVARSLDLRGPVMTLSNGCNSGMDALGLALDWIRVGRADAVLVGGVEAELTPLFYSMMTAARALAVRFNDAPERAMRPFAADRDGNVPGEGAGFLFVESLAAARQRSARVRARLLGYACCAVGDRPPYDPFKPIFEPAPMVRAMDEALADAALSPGDVSLVSANGSSSVFYDGVEAAAIERLFGEQRVLVTSVKSLLGQTGAVTPALQAIAAVRSLETGVVPPTHHVEAPDERWPINLVCGAPLAQRLDHVLANAIGFGGFYYASLVLGRA